MTKKTSTTIWIVVILIVIIGLIIWMVKSQSSASTTAATQTTMTLPADLTDANVTATNHILFGDSFTLTNGQASVTNAHSFSATSTPLVPVDYTLAATAYGDISGSATPGAVSVLYRSFGANIQQLAAFAFTDNGGSLTQVASGVIYTGKVKVQSIAIDKGVITVSVLVVSAADMANLPASSQTPTAPETIQFRVSGTSFVALQ